MASNFWGHKRQAIIPTNILGQLKVTFTAPAKGGAEFELSIDQENIRGEVISGQINVKRTGIDWDNQDYYVKRKHLEKITEAILKLSNSKLTKTIEYINA